MKFMIILCTVLLFAGAQAGVSDGFKAVYEKIESGIQSASEQIQKVIESATSTAGGIAEELKDKADHVIEDFKKNIGKLVKEVRARAEKIIDDAGGNASECKAITSSFERLADDATKSMKSCVSEKFELNKLYRDNMSKITEELKENLNVIKHEAKECVKSVNGIISASKAFVCLNVVGVKASWISMKTIPAYSKNMAQITYLLTTLPLTIPMCAAIDGYSDFISTSNQIVEEVQSCVRDKSS